MRLSWGGLYWVWEIKRARLDGLVAMFTDVDTTWCPVWNLRACSFSHSCGVQFPGCATDDHEMVGLFLKMILIYWLLAISRWEAQCRHIRRINVWGTRPLFLQRKRVLHRPAFVSLGRVPRNLPAPRAKGWTWNLWQRSLVSPVKSTMDCCADCGKCRHVIEKSKSHLCLEAFQAPFLPFQLLLNLASKLRSPLQSHKLMMSDPPFRDEFLYPRSESTLPLLMITMGRMAKRRTGRDKGISTLCLTESLRRKLPPRVFAGKLPKFASVFSDSLPSLPRVQEVGLQKPAGPSHFALDTSLCQVSFESFARRHSLRPNGFQERSHSVFSQK